MTKQRSTKRAMLVSGLALLLCVSMFIGTTFAWFTDSVSSTNNIIKSGNLDVELYWSTDAENWEEVDNNTNVFKNELWEPGHTEVVYLKVVNAGTLALKYNLGVNIADEVGSTNVNGKDFKLSDYIYYDAIESEENIVYATREDARKAVVEPVQIKTAYTDDSELYPKDTDGKLSEEYVALVVYMPEEIGNEANYAKGEAVPTIHLGINLFATQYTYEKDSFDDQYDADAGYPPIAWDGSVDISWFDAGKTEFTISNGAQLAGMAELGNQLGGKTITLDSDVDLGGKNWTPIKIFAPEQSFTFDGGNHTIYNLSITGGSPDVGLFDHSVGTIKNLKLSDAQIKSGGRSAILAGRHYGDIINCHVKDSTIEDSYWAVGGIVGQLNSGNIKNCSVTNVNVKSNGGVGGIVGVLNETGGTRTIENCSVIGGTIENTGLYGASYSGGGVLGMINISNINNPTVNITGCNSTATLKGEYIFEICPPA